MKHLIFCCLISLASFACSSQADSSSNDKDNYAYTAAYVCPMHCDGSGSEEAGKCPVCKMDYVKNEKSESTTTPTEQESEPETESTNAES